MLMEPNSVSPPRDVAVIGGCGAHWYAAILVQCAGGVKGNGTMPNALWHYLIVVGVVIVLWLIRDKFPRRQRLVERDQIPPRQTSGRVGGGGSSIGGSVGLETVMLSR